MNLRITTPEHDFEVPTNAQVVAYRGSIAHGMHDPKPDSVDDIDIISVHVAPKEYYIGLGEWGSRGTQEHKQGRYDIVSYELRKLVRLLIQGNPNVLSLLWTNPKHVLFKTPAWQSLLDLRELFVGKHVYNSFAGYAFAQLHKMTSQDPAELEEYLAVTAEMKYRGIHPQHKGKEIITGHDRAWHNIMGWTDDVLREALARYTRKGYNLAYMGDKRKRLVLEHGYDCKNAAHLLRLLRMGVEFLYASELHVDRTGLDREELLSIKNGKMPLAYVKEQAEHQFAMLKIAWYTSKLPAGPHIAEIEKLLVRMIEGTLGWAA